MTTRYENVAQEIRRLIRQGHWVMGQRIPTEPQLCEQFHVSRTTVRQAVQILCGEGLLICRQGLGTFVLDRETARKPIGLSDFSEQVLSGRLSLRREIISIETLSADESQSLVLKEPPGALLKIATRIDHIDDQPISIDRCILPIRYADRLSETDFASPLFYFKWEEKQGLNVHRTDQTLHTEPATPEDCRHLGLNASAWMLVLSEIFFDAEGRVLGQIVTRYRGDTSKLTTSIFKQGSSVK